MHGAALTLFAIGLYATRIIPEFLTAFAYFLVAMLFAVAPASVVFSGFQSTAFWLIFSGLIIGVADDPVLRPGALPAASPNPTLPWLPASSCSPSPWPFSCPRP